MKLKDLDIIIGNAIKNFGEMSNEDMLADMSRPLTTQELVALSYYKAIVQHLVSKGYLQNSKELDIIVKVIDSVPMEEDYS